ncbi:MAG: SemiSWEET family sugar transporter [Candidatus Woesearchaeota archaeon]
MSIIATIAGFYGSLMSCVNFIQAYKIYKRKHSEDVSIITFGVYFIGSFIWIIYGIEFNSPPVIIANVIGVFGIGSVVFMWFKYRKNKPNRENKKS